MTVSRDIFDESRNWTEPQWQQGVPVMDADLNLAMKTAKQPLRRAVCDFLGNGSSDQGFRLTGNPSDPVLSAGGIWVAGLRIELAEQCPASAQPNVPVSFPSGNGIWFLDVVEVLLTEADDPVIRDSRLPANVDTPIKTFKTDWTLRKVSGSTLPDPEPDHYHIALAMEAAGAFTDVRNAGMALAGIDTGFYGRIGGRPGSGHGHEDEEVRVQNPHYAGDNLEEVLDEIDLRIEAVESGSATPTAHASSHQDGGADSVDLGSLAPPSSDVDLGNKKIVQLAEPGNPSDAATKNYVDSHAGETFPGYGGNPPDVATAPQTGTAATAARSDHTHRGVHHIRAASFNFHGDVQLVPGDGINILAGVPDAGDIKIQAHFSGATAPQPVSVSGSLGSSPVPARSDHVHAIAPSLLRYCARFIVDASGNGDFTDLSDALNALGTSNGEIFVRHGSYTIDASITKANLGSVAIIGEGPGITRLVGGPGLVTGDLLSLTSADAHLHVQGITIDSGAAGWGHGLRLDTFGSATVSHVEFTAAGLRLSSRAAAAANCLFQGARGGGQAIRADGKSTGTIRIVGNRIGFSQYDHSQVQEIFVSAAFHTLIQDNVIVVPETINASMEYVHGIMTYSYTRRAIITGNHIRNKPGLATSGTCGAVVLEPIDGAQNAALVSGNIMENYDTGTVPANGAILVQAGQAASRDNVFVNCPNTEAAAGGSLDSHGNVQF